MKIQNSLPVWTIAAPVLGWLALGGKSLMGGDGAPGLLLLIVLAACLFGGVLAAVFHAELVAHKIGEPFGTLVLAVAVTSIEVALIVSLMVAGGAETTGLARDTVYAAVMLILNGMVGICLLVGGRKHGEQSFTATGVSAALATLAAISVLTMVLPNYTTTTPGPSYNTSQLIFIAVISLVLYGTFVLVQTVRHRDYFLPAQPVADEDDHAPAPPVRMAWISGALLLACLGCVVLLAKALSPSLEKAVLSMGAPKALVGIIIAAVVLLPEGIAAYQAARANRLQTSLNLALGSALASIGLTIPCVAIVALLNGWTLTLGIDVKSTVLLVLSLIVASLSLTGGRTTIMQGTVLLTICAVYLFVTIVP
ncbi:MULTISPECIES: calcium:proton antiporter [unclassified Duganella]|jgi:Ca2+:H+ antiporter|uniref:calcium:proton antiporter n=1 Tax=unclassified Duganella TaxID=2636909 RepID=UPI00088F3514|nr:MULTISPECIES: ionic transporter y4hA [unclassified Duganella]SDG77769.1 Ca2+:H+ antiporter [Duganella sp. OV458]SDK04773.1 Ca2+:H+ antiporter [Duganella sp. OV510]